MPGTNTTDPIDYNYSTHDIADMLEEKEPTSRFLTDMFFSNPVYSDSEFVSYDIVVAGKKMAPFVSPKVGGKVMKKEGSTTNTIRPAYLKPKGILRPSDTKKRLAGEDIRRPMSRQQRMDHLVAKNFIDHEDMVDERLEWMASSALTTGTIEVSGDEFQTINIDFNHSNKLKIKAKKKWSDPTADPDADIETASLAVVKESKGAVVDTIVMCSVDWGHFRKNKIIREQLDINKADSSRTPMDLGPSNMRGARFVGVYAGKYNVWTYDAFYEDDENGEQLPHIPEGKVLLVSRESLDGEQHFGAIEDLDAGMVSVKVFHKTMIIDDPSALAVLSQSAPLLVPKRVNAFAILTVKW